MARCYFCPLLVILLALMAGCSSSASSLSDFRQQLESFDADSAESLQQSLARQYQHQSAPVINMLVDWGLNHSHQLFILTLHQSQGLIDHLAQRAVTQGKSFVLIERLLAQNQQGHPLYQALTAAEQVDGRRLVGRVAQGDVYQRVVAINGHGNGLSWQGAAFIIAESQCQMVLTSAAHNLVDVLGAPRIPLADFDIEYDHSQLTLQSIKVPAEPLDPMGDWALLVAEKRPCSEPYFSQPVSLADEWLPLDEKGADVELVCFHQARTDTRDRLYTEACHINPVGEHVLDYYADRSPEPLAIHGCQSEPGSSGCPVLINSNGELALLATQIEGDRQTGAGIARLVQGDFRQALEQAVQATTNKL